MLLETIISVLIVVGAYLIYKHVREGSHYWRDRGIPCVKGSWPIIGNNLPLLKMHQSFITLFNDFYMDNPDHSMVGYYNFQTPGVIIRDPELVKAILLTGFSSFDTNTSSLDPHLDPLLSRNPFFSDGLEWKTNRTIMLNGLSSRKLKLIALQIRDVCTKLSKYLEAKTRGETVTMNFVDDIASRFTADVVAIASFGIDGQSFTDSPENFASIASSMFQPASNDEFIHILALFFPFVAKLLRLRFLPKKLDCYFRQVIKDVLESRKKSGENHGDFLQQVCDLCRKKDDSDEIDEAAVATHTASFFLDGHLTSGMTMNFAAYQIASHPEVQEKLRQEVTAIFDQYQGEITYEALQSMKYMDQVINESMRLLPALGYLGKVCTERFKLKGYDGLECVIEPGTEVIICTMALQRDPRFWKNPDIFDPENFNDETKNNRHKYVFLPFGSGPRICIGMRVALMQIKAALATLLRDYSIEVDPKTQEPLGVHPLSAIFTAPSSDIYIRVKPLHK